MNKNDAELTRKAIAEIFQDMHEHRKQEEMPQERKINPLGRTNKNFLGRTLHAMVRHNKRADEQTRKKCNKRLRELDRYREHKGSTNEGFKKRKKKRVNRSETESTSSETSSRKRKRKKSKLKHKKKKKRHSRERSSSSKSDKCLNTPQEEILPPYYENYDYENNDYSSAYMMWDLQMQQFYQYKALMTLGAAAQASTATEPVPVVEIETSSTSLSDIKLEESSSSSCSSSNEKVYTINVSTDSDNDGHKKKESNKKDHSKETNVGLSIEIVDSDSISVKSIVSITSTDNAIDLTED